MQQQERDQLSKFLSALESASAGNKVPDAENLIKATLARQPDAGYLLVQRCLLMEQALQNAQHQINTLQQQIKDSEASRQGGGFLGSNPWGKPPATDTSSSPVPGSTNYQMPGASRNAAAPWQAQATGQGSSFLGNIASTAAGVVAGSFLFQGIENLMGHHQGNGFLSGNDMQHEAVADQTIINNYYGSEANEYDTGYDTGSSGFMASDDQDYLQDDDSSDWV